MQVRLGESSLIPIGLLIFLGILLYLTTDLSPVARSVPLAVLVSTLAFVAVQAVLEIFPGLARRVGGIEHADAFDIEALRKKTEVRAEPPDASNQRRREVELFAWMALMMIFIYVLGLLITVPLFLFLFLSRRSGESLRLSAGLALAGLALVYGIFVHVLGAPLYEGQLWIWIRS